MAFLILPLFIIIGVSYIIVRIGTVALTLTGMDEEKARFQALSAFTGTGFTTEEAEAVVKHPVRRKIVMTLMVLGNAGLASVIATLILSFARGGLLQTGIKISILGIGLYIMYRIASHKGLTRKLTSKIEERLSRRKYFTRPMWEEMLHLPEEYGIVDIWVNEKMDIANKSIGELNLREKGVLVIIIERGRKVIPVPGPNNKLKPGDRAICFGKLETLQKIS